MDRPHAYFWSGDALRGRAISDHVLTAAVEVPAPSARLREDWQRETSTRMMLQAGEVEAMPLARTQMRWPDYGRCVQAVSNWTTRLDLAGVLANADVALMACRGANYHHDAIQYGGSAFCNLFLSEDRDLEVYFPRLDLRIPLACGTAMLFDTGQPHSVIRRGSSGYSASDFAMEWPATQIFLSWELPIEDARVARALAVDFDTAPAPLGLDQPQVWLNNQPVEVCLETGEWQPVS